MSMEQKVKERVVGATVLMAAAAIFIPMILSGPADERSAARSPPPPADDRDGERASADAFSSRIVPLDGRTRATAPAPQSESPTASPAPPGPPQPAPPGRRSEPPPARAAVSPSKPPEPKPPPAPDPAPGEGWMVQLGSFANPRNAYALRDRLKRKGYAALAVSSGTGKDAVTRVYVGPEADRARAEAHVARLLEETRLKGIVVRNPGS